MNPGRRSKKDLFVQWSFSMLNSEAYKMLSPNAIALYNQIAKRYNGQNNGDISFSCREAMNALRIGRATSKRAFDQLIEYGFIKVTQNSSFSFKTQKARRFELTQWPIRKGTAPSNDWRFWKPKE